jgi:hypothetical protein
MLRVLRGYRPDGAKPCCSGDLSDEGGSMKERLLCALSQSALEGKKVTQLQVWSQQATNAITSSADFFRGTFLGIPVVFLGRSELSSAEDFVLIYKD